MARGGRAAARGASRHDPAALARRAPRRASACSRRARCGPARPRRATIRAPARRGCAPWNACDGRGRPHDPPLHRCSAARRRRGRRLPVPGQARGRAARPRAARHQPPDRAGARAHPRPARRMGAAERAGAAAPGRAAAPAARGRCAGAVRPPGRDRAPPARRRRLRRPAERCSRRAGAGRAMAAPTAIAGSPPAAPRAPVAAAAAAATAAAAAAPAPAPPRQRRQPPRRRARPPRAAAAHARRGRRRRSAGTPLQRHARRRRRARARRRARRPRARAAARPAAPSHVEPPPPASTATPQRVAGRRATHADRRLRRSGGQRRPMPRAAGAVARAAAATLPGARYGIASADDPRPPAPGRCARRGRTRRRRAAACCAALPRPRRRARTVVRVTQPDLARRAILDRTRGRLVIAAFGFARAVRRRGAEAGRSRRCSNPAEPRRAAALSRPPAPAAEAPVARATITDRNGEILAVSLPRDRALRQPAARSRTRRAVADRLRRVLPQLDRERADRARLTGERQFAYIARALTPREAAGGQCARRPRPLFRAGRAPLLPAGPHRRAHHRRRRRGRPRHRRRRALLRRAAARAGERTRCACRSTSACSSRCATRCSAAITDFNGIGGAGVADGRADRRGARDGQPAGLRPADPIAARRRRDRVEQATTSASTAPPSASTSRAPPSSCSPPRWRSTTARCNIWGGYDASRPIRIGRFEINDFRGKDRWLALPEILAYSSNLASAHMAAAVGANAPPRVHAAHGHDIAPAHRAAGDRAAAGARAAATGAKSTP